METILVIMSLYSNGCFFVRPKAEENFLGNIVQVCGGPFLSYEPMLFFLIPALPKSTLSKSLHD